MTAADASLRHTLEAASAQLGLPLASAQTDTLLAHLALLQRWNAVYNLTSVREPSQMLTLHLVDCLAAIPAVRKHFTSIAQVEILDVGSGGGLPGVVLATMFPQAQVTCVDTVGKKAAFIQQAATELALPNLKALHARVENSRGASYDLITSRAFASLADFVSLTQHLLRSGGAWMAMKGKTPSDELEQLPAGTDVFHVEPLRVPGLDAERCLIWMRPSA